MTSIEGTALANDVNGQRIRTPLNPDLLHYPGLERAPNEDARSVLVHRFEPPARYSLYDADLNDVQLDFSVALKPGRLMSLDAVW